MPSNTAARTGSMTKSGLPEASVISSQVTQNDSADPLIEQLARALLSPVEADEVLRGFYTDAFHSALLERLADRRGASGSGAGPRNTKQLPPWRLRRVRDYVESNLNQRLSLALLAAAAGLSSMYFAAQFRAATGRRPHDYVVHRRVQRAKTMLAETSEPNRRSCGERWFPVAVALYDGIQADRRTHPAALAHDARACAMQHNTGRRT